MNKKSKKNVLFSYSSYYYYYFFFFKSIGWEKDKGNAIKQDTKNAVTDILNQRKTTPSSSFFPDPNDENSWLAWKREKGILEVKKIMKKKKKKKQIRT
jgi:hypothetical protein